MVHSPTASPASGRSKNRVQATSCSIAVSGGAAHATTSSSRSGNPLYFLNGSIFQNLILFLQDAEKQDATFMKKEMNLEEDATLERRRLSSQIKLKKIAGIGSSFQK